MAANGNTPIDVLIIGPAFSGKSRFALTFPDPQPQDGEAGVTVEKIVLSTHPRENEFFNRETEELEKMVNENDFSRIMFNLDLTQSLEKLNAGFTKDEDGQKKILVIDSVNQWLGGLISAAGGKYDWEQMGSHLEYSQNELIELIAEVAIDKDITLRIVTSEAGACPPPTSANTRLFRKNLGILNQKLAGLSKAVYLVQAGIPQKIK